MKLLSENGKRCEWAAFELLDQLHTLLATDNLRAGDARRGNWHLRRRDDRRRWLDAAASAFCGRAVTGYTR